MGAANNERKIEVRVFGLLIAHATGWDEVDVTSFQFYQPEFTEVGKALFKRLPPDIRCLQVDPWNGIFIVFVPDPEAVGECGDEDLGVLLEPRWPEIARRVDELPPPPTTSYAMSYADYERLIAKE